MEISTFYSTGFFMPHPLRNILNPMSDLMANSITSQYSMTNIHEWFADAFAATALNDMGRSQLLGPRWQNLIIKNPRHVTRYWSNYNNVSSLFMNWLRSEIKKINQ